MTPLDRLTEALATTARDAGLIACVQPPRNGGHVEWGNRYGSGGPISGVRWIVIQDPVGDDWPIVAQVRLEDEGDHGGYHDLGFAYEHRRVGTMRWRIAEGYTNGFRKRDILWYALTRWKGNLDYLKRRRGQ